MPDNLIGAKPDGVVKFNISRQLSAPAHPLWTELDRTRCRLWQQGLIGHDPVLAVGYGNISLRLAEDQFLISASQTGHKPCLTADDYVIVDGWDFGDNSVCCRGSRSPSSEALSHAALYGHPAVQAVIHVHNAALWRSLIATGATSTAADIPYGSPALFRAFQSLLTAGAGRAFLPLVVVTIGHEAGVFVAAASLESAHQALTEKCGQFSIPLPPAS